MSLKNTINHLELKEAMIKVGRDNFSRLACQIIINYYDDMEEDTEFYPVDIDCTFVEYDLSDPDDLSSFLNDYSYLVDGEEFSDEDSRIERLMDLIEENTLVLSSDYNCFIFDYNF